MLIRDGFQLFAMKTLSSGGVCKLHMMSCILTLLLYPTFWKLYYRGWTGSQPNSTNRTCRIYVGI